MTSESSDDKKQPHALKLKAWPPEVTGEGLGILGVILLAAIFFVIFKPNIGALLERTHEGKTITAQR